MEPASEAGPLELFCAEFQICFSQPRRERFRYCAAVEKRFRLVEQKTPALVRWYNAFFRVKNPYFDQFVVFGDRELPERLFLGL